MIQLEVGAAPIEALRIRYNHRTPFTRWYSLKAFLELFEPA